jgi:hypothetical protein
MVQIKLKAKHFYLISEILFGYAAYTSFSTLEKIKSACNGANDDDLVTVESEVDTVVNVFSELSKRPEGSYNQINGEMIDILTPQITEGTNLGDPEWIKLGESIAEIRETNLSIITNSIISGKSRLYS